MEEKNFKVNYGKGVYSVSVKKDESGKYFLIWDELLRAGLEYDLKKCFSGIVSIFPEEPEIEPGVFIFPFRVILSAKEDFIIFDDKLEKYGFEIFSYTDFIEDNDDKEEILSILDEISPNDSGSYIELFKDHKIRVLRVEKSFDIDLDFKLEPEEWLKKQLDNIFGGFDIA